MYPVLFGGIANNSNHTLQEKMKGWGRMRKCDDQEAMSRMCKVLKKA